MIEFSNKENQELLMEIMNMFKEHNVCKQKRRFGSRKQSRRHYRDFNLLGKFSVDSDIILINKRF